MTMTDSEYIEQRDIATTIIAQLGGQSLLNLMVGAREFMMMPKGNRVRGGLQFSLPAFGKPRVNKVCIELNTMDLYDMSFYFLRAGKAKLVARVPDVWCENLKTVFEEQTGLTLRRPSFIRALP